MIEAQISSVCFSMIWAQISSVCLSMIGAQISSVFFSVIGAQISFLSLKHPDGDDRPRFHMEHRNIVTTPWRRLGAVTLQLVQSLVFTSRRAKQNLDNLRIIVVFLLFFSLTSTFSLTIDFIIVLHLLISTGNYSSPHMAHCRLVTCRQIQELFL